ncbi:MAG: DeoR family transcriptional regulator [Candidatus Liptonbacteria bacterium]|nr:DeoR family transcriptional regulator [Candidatus Liptonbacteria bacterium]MBI3114754.1 DeoR family transcriptional regulator [Candidatus Harrisonbacteria bacterium]
MQDEAGKFVGKKLYEISYALCRIAARIHPSVGSRIEESAFRIAESGVSLNPQKIRESLEIARMQVKLGSDTGIINKGNGDLVLDGLAKLESVLRTLRDIEIGNRADIEGVFSAQDFLERRKPKAADDMTVKTEIGNIRHSIETRERQYEEDGKSAEVRQSEILNFIEKSGNCRMKDLLEQFPGSSERTIRYDLQHIAGKGLIERVGEGGPGTYYRYKSPFSQPSGGISGEANSNL